MPTLYEADRLNRETSEEVGRPINPLDNQQYVAAVGVQSADPLNDDDYAVYLANKDWVTKAEAAVKDGTGSQAQLDEAVAATYSDPVKHFAGSTREYTEGNEVAAKQEDEYDGSYIAARRELFKANPELEREFNRAATFAGLSYNAIPEKSSGFWDNVAMSYQQYATMANTTDIEVLNGVRQMVNQTYTVPEAVLTDDVPELYHAMLLQEQLKYGDAAAMLKKDQLRDDINNNRILQDMPWYAQLGYGALGLAMDPLTWATGGVTAEVGAAVKSGTVLAARKLAPSGIKASEKLPVKAAAAMADWVTMAGTESALINGTRLAGGDHTYTLAQYKVDVLADSIIGGVLGTVINVGGAVRATQQAAHQARVDEAVHSMERMKQQTTGDKSTVSDRTTLDDVSPFRFKAPDYEHRWVPAPTDKVSNWIRPEEMKVLSKSDQVALARYRKKQVEPQLPDTATRMAAIAEKQLRVNPHEPRMTLSAMTELNSRHGIEDFTTNELNRKMQEGYLLWKPKNNEQKWLGNAVIDSVTKLNASMHIIRRMTQAVDAADVKYMTDDLRAEVGNIDLNIQRMTNAWQWTRELNNEQYADMVMGLDNLVTRADTLIKQVDAGDFVRRDNGDSPLGMSRDVDEYSDVVDIDFTQIIKEVVDDPLAPSILAKYEDSMKDIPIAFAKVQMERSQAVSTNIQRIIRGDAPKSLDPLLQDIAGMTQGQFNVARATILNSPLGRDPAFLRSDYRNVLNDTVAMFKAADTDEALKKAQSVALDVVELGVLYRNGMPPQVLRGLNQLKYKKDIVYVDNAFNHLTNIEANRVQGLEHYVDSLRGMFREDVTPASAEELNDYFKLGSDGVMDTRPDSSYNLGDSLDDVSAESLIDELGGVTSTKYQQPFDLYKLNKDMEGLGQDAKNLLEELNGMMIQAAKSRAEQGAIVRVAKFKAVKNTGDDIMAHMRAEGLTAGTPEYRARFKELRNQNHVAFQKGNSELQAELNAVGELRFDDTGENLLPQSYTVSKTMHDKSRYMEVVQQTVRGMLQHGGVNNRHWQNKSAAKMQVQKLNAIKHQLRKNTDAVVARMVASGDMVHLVDVLRATASLKKDRAARLAFKKRKLEEAQMMEKQAAAREEAVAAELNREVRAARGPLPLDELEVAITNKTAELKGVTSEAELTKLKGELGNMMVMRERMRYAEPPRDLVALQQEITELTHDIPPIERMNTMQRAMTAEEVNKLSMHKIIQGLDDYANGEVHVDTASVAPRDWVASLGALAGRAAGLTKEFADTFRMHDSIAMKFLGFRLTESGRGNAGSVQRRHTAAVIKEAEYTKSISQILPSYAEAMDAFAVSRGRGAVARLNAKTMAGADSELVNEFNRAFFKYQNDMKLGRKPVENSVISKFVKDWNEYMDYNHGRLTEQGVAGFVAGRKLAHYVPQVWKVVHLRKAYAEKPQDVLELFTKGYRAAGHDNPVELAEGQINHLLGMGEQADQFLPSADARSKTQLKIDQGVEHNGLTLLDMLDTEVAGVATKYSNRVGGWVSINKATDGVLNNGVDLTNMRSIIEQETKSKTAVRDFDDLIDMLMGRPTRDGLPPWLRSVKDLTVLTRMGALGTAQAIETGSVMTRGLLEAAGDPEFLKRVMKGISDEDAPAELQELMRLTGYNKDYEWLNRQSVYLDQRQFAEISKAAELSNTIVDKATGGSLKAPASRLLSQVSGYNAVRKYQSMIMQRSFGMAVARHFKYGTSKMSPRRMADIGLTDSKGVNPKMHNMINRHVEFDDAGYPVKYNFDKWDKDALEVFQYSMQRAESQDIIRASIGELPRWMNMPLMQVVTQFRTIPILSNNKALARSMAFGDREAVTSLALNVITAGLVRSAKVALLAGGYAVIKGTEFSDEYQTKWDNYGRDSMAGGAIDKYITAVGIYPEISSIAVIGNQAWQNVQDAGNTVEGAKIAANAAFGQIPALSLLRDGYKTGEAVTEGDLDNAVKEVQGITMLGNTAMMEMIFTALEANMKGE